MHKHREKREPITPPNMLTSVICLQPLKSNIMDITKHIYDKLNLM